MFKTILVPINLSQIEAGLVALERARGVADVHGGRLVLLNVVERVPGFIADKIPSGLFEKAQSDAADELKDLVSQQGLGDTAEVVVRGGHVSQEILDFAAEIGTDMIVIAAHDHGLADYLLGSVAGRVVRDAHCSVLVARKLDN